MSIPSIASYPLPEASSLPDNKVNWPVESERAVLLIHDMQEYFVRFYGEHSSMMAQVQKNIVALREWAKRHQVPVIYTAQPAQQSPEQRALLNDMWGPGLTDTDPTLQQVVSPLAPGANDTVLVKWRYSAFQRSNLQQIMEAANRDQLLICGIYAHIGCLTTAIDAFMRDIKPFMVADAVADFSEDEHRMALKYVATRCGVVTSLEDVLTDESQSGITRQWLERRLLSLIDEDPEQFDADENLIDYGLDSVQVMGMVSEWEKQGIDVSFEELARTPSLNGWWSIIEKKQQVSAQ